MINFRSKTEVSDLPNRFVSLRNLLACSSAPRSPNNAAFSYISAAAFLSCGIPIGNIPNSISCSNNILCKLSDAEN